ncbi:MAG TPA: hypothetical protein DG577_06185 [Firmicutes bacterium]|nr:hypothetical protein [Bacillota bacterium]
MVDAAQEVAGAKVLTQRVDAADMASLRLQAEQVLATLDSGVVVLGAPQGDKVNLVAVVSPDLVSRGAHAGKIIGVVAKAVGGGGGGRSDMAQAGGKDPSQLETAFALVPQLVAQQLS